MPVVGRGNHHGINVFSIQDLAVVLIGIGLSSLTLLDFLDIFAQNPRIHVGECGENSVPERFAGDRPSLVPQANRRKDWTFVRRLIAEGPGGRKQKSRRTRGGRRLKKLTSR